MMSGPMSATTRTPPPAETRARQRAEWLRCMPQPEREDLIDLSLREVARFAAWPGSAARRAEDRG